MNAIGKYNYCDECYDFETSGYTNPYWKLCPQGCFTRTTGEARQTRKKKKNASKNFVFITINDLQTRMKDIEGLLQFIKRISYMYSEGHWVIETGKNEEEKDFNIHIHLLVKIKDCIHNHKTSINAKWMGVRDTSLYDLDYYQLDQHRKSDDMPEYDDWVIEKMTYFDNDKKGTHTNTIDLELSGQFGKPT